MIPEQVRLAAYRTAEEALTNAMKHAEASAVTITVGSPDEGWLGIAVQDDGEGFDLEGIRSTGWPRFGLQTMRERVESTGGSFALDSAVGKGTKIILQVPLLVEQQASV